MYVSKEEIERVRRGHDLVAAIRSRGIELTRKGRNWVGLCPFHDDREPSLVVNPAKQLWNCFGACRSNGGKSGGDVFAFVAKLEGISFLEALKRLGYEEPEAPARAGRRSRSTSVSEPVPAIAPADPALLARVATHYHRAFRERPEGQDYLKQRGLDDPEMLEAFEVGYVDGTLRATFDAEGGTAEALKAAGVINARGREHFLGCIVVPLTFPDAGVVGFYGRHVEHDRHLYLPGPRRGVFHWQALKGSEEVILAESVIDALTLWRAGFRNVSCVYGTQGFTDDHAELLERFRVRRVLLWLDNDDAGNQATAAIAERIGKLGIDVVDARIEGAKDPNELYVSLGADAFQKRVAASLPLTVKTTAKERSQGGDKPRITHEPGGGRLIAFAERTYRVRGLTANGLDRLRVNLRIEGSGQTHLDTLDLYSHRTRTGLVKELARLFDRDEEAQSREIAELIETLEALRLEQAQHGDGKPADSRVEITNRDREEALRLLCPS